MIVTIPEFNSASDLLKQADTATAAGTAPTSASSATSSSTPTSSTSSKQSSSSSSSGGGSSGGSNYKPRLDTRALAEASKNLTQTLKQLSSEVLTTKADEVSHFQLTFLNTSDFGSYSLICILGTSGPLQGMPMLRYRILDSANI